MGLLKNLLGKFVFVEGGEFMMGSPFDPDGKDNECEHRVKLDSFYIQETVVTQEIWVKVMDENPSYNKEWSDMPVTDVSWYDAIKFCKKLNKIAELEQCYSKDDAGEIICNWSAKGYRLPTEAEWEYSAKGGNKGKGFLYSGSDELYEVGWCNVNSDRTIHRVKGKIPNELDIYDMSGNVWEWCWDWYDDYRDTFGLEKNPLGPSIGRGRILRGGSYTSFPFDCKSTNRSFAKPDIQNNSYGFRLVRIK